MTKTIYLYKHGHDRAETQGRPDLSAPVTAAAVHDGNLLVTQSPEMIPRVDYVDLESFGFVFFVDSEKVSEPNEDERVYSIDAGKAGTFKVNAIGKTSGPNGHVILTAEDAAVKVLHLTDEFADLITSQPAHKATGEEE